MSHNAIDATWARVPHCSQSSADTVPVANASTRTSKVRLGSRSPVEDYRGQAIKQHVAGPNRIRCSR